MNKNEIEIYYINGDPVFNVEPMGLKRNWMDQTINGTAYRCIPLNVANQYGWQVLSPIEFCANWNGGSLNSDMEVHFHEECKVNVAASHFGYGILTIVPDFVVQTPKDVSLHVRGIPNEFIDGLSPLEGIVETDWLPFTFTYNIKFTRPGEVIFKKGQPLFTMTPIDKNYIESFSLAKKDLSENNDLLEKSKSFGKSRMDHIRNNTPEIQGYYSRGEVPGFGKINDRPQKRIKLDG
jgi:hypothetical protein